jgi:hypothetical protein
LNAARHHAAHDCAERLRERLPRRLQELREGCGLSMYALWMKCGVSRDIFSVSPSWVAGWRFVLRR